ncbi:tripartite tricarboxylate transporter permease [Ruegeria sp. Ofav3-42]|uniref:tripartite tricarboxylate transporter permease n=1 Tax=Ruegeria sp. Ofav3-42 TaxID=2917759 RepID=UPI001EF6ED2E|nr:tripartite tricarboxylate transporter permease [Ruegeria sp. Ofav3-42]MCG7521958.1 tripartite tricarboxylate transporter permease [Ruegeria sp. Ofav3-42]
MSHRHSVQGIAGFQAALTVYNLLFVGAGLTLGIVIGVIPGLGSVTAMAVLIPLTFYMSPLAAIGFLVDINKGGTSGGAIPAILLNSPGTPESAASALDGYPMAKRGEPERAMKFALYSSVTGDMLSDILLIVLVVPFAAIALQFGPLELASILLFAFTLLAGISSNSPQKGLIAIFLGIFLASIGLDPIDSSPRMTFGSIYLYDGLSLSAVAIGSLALASVADQILTARKTNTVDGDRTRTVPTSKIRSLPVTEFFSHWKTILRSTMIGSGIGMLPGLGVTLAAFLSYGASRRASKDPDSFGKGNPEGIIATEAANSAVVGANLVPALALGIPGNVAAALLLSALIIHGVTPGPFMMTMHGDLIYALFASMLMANVLHLIIGRVGIPIWASVARVRRRYILPAVVFLCVTGAYLPGQSLFDVGTMLAFSVVGLIMNRTGFSVVCMVIGFILGDLFETAMRQSVLLYKGNLNVIWESPIAIVFVVLSILVILGPLWRHRLAKYRSAKSAD